jgi:hypothetical protein
MKFRVRTTKEISDQAAKRVAIVMGLIVFLAILSLLRHLL